MNDLTRHAPDWRRRAPSLHPRSDICHHSFRMTALHTVQFFDAPESLGRNVAAFVVEGIAQGEHLMLVARAAHVEAIADAMALSGVLMRELVASRQMTVIDAAVVLRGLMF